MTKFTPGPWTVWGKGYSPWCVMPHEHSPAYQDRHSRGIATMENWDPGEAKANAHLIAAAPDLLAALEALLPLADWALLEQSPPGADDPLVDQARAAILKARGK